MPEPNLSTVTGNYLHNSFLVDSGCSLGWGLILPRHAPEERGDEGGKEREREREVEPRGREREGGRRGSLWHGDFQDKEKQKEEVKGRKGEENKDGDDGEVIKK